MKRRGEKKMARIMCPHGTQRAFFDTLSLHPTDALPCGGSITEAEGFHASLAQQPAPIHVDRRACHKVVFDQK
jgi:hypothetical protein